MNSYTRFISEERQKEILAEGRAEGKAEGRTEGMIKALYQIANMTVQDIAENLKITEEEVKQHLTTKSRNIRP